MGVEGSYWGLNKPRTTAFAIIFMEFVNELATVSSEPCVQTVYKDLVPLFRGVDRFPIRSLEKEG